MNIREWTEAELRKIARQEAAKFWKRERERIRRRQRELHDDDDDDDDMED